MTNEETRMVSSRLVDYESMFTSRVASTHQIFPSTNQYGEWSQKAGKHAITNPSVVSLAVL